MNKKFLLATMITGMACITLIETQSVIAADPDISAGEEIYQKSCKSCHGPTAKGMASFPKLSDKDADYLVDRLRQYRSGETIGPNSPLMRPNAENLSDDDISNIAHYISTRFN